MSHQPKQAAARQFLSRFFADEIRAWKGDARLSTVFWRKGVLTSFVLIALYASTVFLRQLIAEQILLVLSGLYTVWILVSIWRCSLAVDTAWALLARFLTVAWAANVALVLFFRQLELLAAFAGLTGA